MHLKGNLLASVLVSLWCAGDGALFAADATKWVPLNEAYRTPDLRTVYVDGDGLVRQGDAVVVRQLMDYRLMQGNTGFGRFGLGPHRFFSTITKKEFHCPDRRVRLLTFTEFSHHMGIGQPANGYVDQSQWLPVEPASLNEGLWKVACLQQ